MPSQVLSLRLSPDNPHERLALEYLERELAAGRSSREIVADALVLAASNEQATQRLMATTQAIAQQQQEMLQMMETFRKRGVVAIEQHGESEGSNAPLSAGMRSLLSNQRRPLVSATE